MKKLLLLLLCLPLFVFGQVCTYNGSDKDAVDLCNLLKRADGFDFENLQRDKNIDLALEKVLSVTGISKNFILLECNHVDNCAAVTYKGIRYILYNKSFMYEIAQTTGSWSNFSILAHEIGHHVNGHTLDLIVALNKDLKMKPPELKERRQDELEADEYSGFIMYKLGASLSESQKAVSLLSKYGDDKYSTHPSRDKRFAAIERGYNKSKTLDEYSNAPSPSDKFFYKSYEYFEQGRFQLAVDNLTECIKIDPKLIAAYYNRAKVYHLLGNLEAALVDYSKAIKLNKKDSDGYNNRGNVYEDLGNFDDAISDYNRSIKLDPENPNGYYNRGLLYAKLESYNDALFDFSKAIELDSKDPDSFNNRGNVYKALGRIEDAISDYTRCVRIDPDYAGAYNNRGDAYKSLDNFEDAIADYTRSIRIEDNNPYSYFKRAETHNSLGNTQEAIDDYTSAIFFKSKFDKMTYIWVCYARSKLFYNIKEYQKSIVDLTECINLFPSPQFYIGRASTYTTLERYEESISDFTECIKLEPSATAYWGRGFAKAKMGYSFCGDIKSACDLGSEKCCEWFSAECQ